MAKIFIRQRGLRREEIDNIPTNIYIDTLGEAINNEDNDNRK